MQIAALNKYIVSARFRDHPASESDTFPAKVNLLHARLVTKYCFYRRSSCQADDSDLLSTIYYRMMKAHFEQVNAVLCGQLLAEDYL